MTVLHRLLDFVSPSRDDDAPAASLTRAQRIFFASVAMLAALALGAIWGVAAGSHDHHIALDNVGKVPVLLVGSSLVALPVALLVFKLVAKRGRVTDLVLAHALGLFAGCLALALLSPLVALYQYSSSFAGMPVAVGTALLAIAIVVGVVIRVLQKLSPEGAIANYALPVGLALTLQIAALAQFASITTPVFPTRTPLGRGVDGLVHTAPSADAP